MTERKGIIWQGGTGTRALSFNHWYLEAIITYLR